jgi:hypothetical protein
MLQKSIALTNSQWEYLDGLAKAEGVSTPEYLRWVVRDMQRGTDTPLRPIETAPRMQLLDIRTPDDEFYYAMIEQGDDARLMVDLYIADEPRPIVRLDDAITGGWLWRYPR